jgi:hypothetical protein
MVQCESNIQRLKLNKFKLEEFTLGWVVGNFSPSLHLTTDFEFGVKYFKSGDCEPRHYQTVARELSIVVTGSCRIGSFRLESGEGLMIEAGEEADFEALSDCAIAVIKWPSLPADKILS